MCEELRQASFVLEKSAASAHTSNDTAQEAKAREHYLDFKRAAENFHAFLDQMGV